MGFAHKQKNLIAYVRQKKLISSMRLRNIFSHSVHKIYGNVIKTYIDTGSLICVFIELLANKFGHSTQQNYRIKPSTMNIIVIKIIKIFQSYDKYGPKTPFSFLIACQVPKI